MSTPSTRLPPVLAAHSCGPVGVVEYAGPQLVRAKRIVVWLLMLSEGVLTLGAAIGSVSCLLMIRSIDFDGDSGALAVLLTICGVLALLCGASVEGLFGRTPWSWRRAYWATIAMILILLALTAYCAVEARIDFTGGMGHSSNIIGLGILSLLSGALWFELLLALLLGTPATLDLFKRPPRSPGVWHYVVCIGAALTWTGIMLSWFV